MALTGELTSQMFSLSKVKVDTGRHVLNYNTSVQFDSAALCGKMFESIMLGCFLSNEIKQMTNEVLSANYLLICFLNQL